jgi:hypothetical protein
MTAAKGQGGTPATGSRPPARTPPLRAFFIQDWWGFAARPGRQTRTAPDVAEVPDPRTIRARKGGVRMTTRGPVEAVPRRGSRARGQPALVPRKDARSGGVRAACRGSVSPRPPDRGGLLNR